MYWTQDERISWYRRIFSWVGGETLAKNILVLKALVRPPDFKIKNKTIYSEYQPQGFHVASQEGM